MLLRLRSKNLLIYFFLHPSCLFQLYNLMLVLSQSVNKKRIIPNTLLKQKLVLYNIMLTRAQQNFSILNNFLELTSNIWKTAKQWQILRKARVYEEKNKVEAVTKLMISKTKKSVKLGKIKTNMASLFFY